jgi:hypothetical protein
VRLRHLLLSQLLAALLLWPFYIQYTPVKAYVYRIGPVRLGVFPWDDDEKGITWGLYRLDGVLLEAGSLSPEVKWFYHGKDRWIRRNPNSP